MFCVESFNALSLHKSKMPTILLQNHKILNFLEQCIAIVVEMEQGLNGRQFIAGHYFKGEGLWES